jgi:drug/metabolite transporter (DMT)-like permease
MGFLAVPVVGLVASTIMLGEPLTLLDLVGAATTFAGIVFVSVSTNASGRAAAPGVGSADGMEPELTAGDPALARAEP